MRDTATDEFHGWLVNGLGALHVGRLPGRKSICLYLIDGSVLTPLAYFRDEEKARLALGWMDALADRVNHA